MEEEWCVIDGYFGDYQVSSLGRVKSLKRSTELIMTVSVNSAGYATVVLYIEGVQINNRVHILVAESFLGVRPDGYEVNHKDGDKLNNRADNLEYATPKENSQHAYRIGLCPKGEERYGSKLTAKDVRDIKILLQEGCTQMSIANDYDVCQKTISHIKNGKAWRHVYG
jgi:hypothetical protein